MHMIDTEKVSLPAVATLGNKGSAQSVEELNTATTLLFTTKEEDIEQAGADGAHSSSSSSRQMPEHTKEGKRIVRFRKKDTAARTAEYKRYTNAATRRCPGASICSIT